MKIKELMGTRHNIKAIIPPSWVTKKYTKTEIYTYFYALRKKKLI